MFAPQKKQQHSVWDSILGLFKQHHSPSGGVLMFTIAAFFTRLTCILLDCGFRTSSCLGLKWCLDPDQKYFLPLCNCHWTKWIFIGFHLHLEAFWSLLIWKLESCGMEVNVTFFYHGCVTLDLNYIFAKALPCRKDTAVGRSLLMTTETLFVSRQFCLILF